MPIFDHPTWLWRSYVEASIEFAAGSGTEMTFLISQSWFWFANVIFDLFQVGSGEVMSFSPFP